MPLPDFSRYGTPVEPPDFSDSGESLPYLQQTPEGQKFLAENAVSSLKSTGKIPSVQRPFAEPSAEQMADAADYFKALSSYVSDEGLSRDEGTPTEQFQRAIERPSRVPTRGEKIATGVQGAASRFGKSFAEPVNAALLATGVGAPAVVSRGISAYFL